MATPALAAGDVNTNLACLCPILLSWAPYFMDHNTPYQALLMGKELVATLTDGNGKTRAAPILNWLRASYLVAHGLDRRRSIPDPRAYVVLAAQH
jgi:hypothetical protein